MVVEREGLGYCRGMAEESAEARERISSGAATLAGVGSIVLWCWSGVCYAVGSRAMGAMPYLSLACAVGVATIAITRALRGESVASLVRVPAHVMVAGFFGVAVYSVMLGWAMGTADESDLGQIMLLNYLWPIWIVLLGMVMVRDGRDGSPGAGWMVGLGALMGFGGIVVARGMGAFSHRPASYLPHALAMVGGFLWALYSVLLRRWRVPTEKGGSTFHFIVCAVLAGTIGAMQGAWKSPGSMDAWSAMWVLFGGIGPVGLGYYWWEIAIKRGAVHLVTLLAYFIPIGSAVLIGLFFKEAMSRWLIVGAMMIAAGAWVGHRAASEG